MLVNTFLFANSAASLIVSNTTHRLPALLVSANCLLLFHVSFLLFKPCMQLLKLLVALILVLGLDISEQLTCAFDASTITCMWAQFWRSCYCFFRQVKVNCSRLAKYKVAFRNGILRRLTLWILIKEAVSLRPEHLRCFHCILLYLSLSFWFVWMMVWSESTVHSRLDVILLCNLLHSLRAILLS